jgi:hypothetical protein
LLNVEILEKLNDRVGCQAALTQIPAESASFPGAVELEAKLLMREGRSALDQTGNRANALAAANARYQQAIEKLKLVESNGKATAALDLRAKYMTAMCWLES